MKWLKKYFPMFIFILLFLATRLPRLHNDIVSTDAVYWHDRSEKFLNAITSGDFEETYQQYHPGVTLMWTTALTAKVCSLVSSTSATEVFENFESIHFYGKLTLVSLQLLLSLFCMQMLAKIYDAKKAFFIVTLFSLEPFFVGNSRLLHLDVPITLFILTAFLILYQNLQKFTVSKTIILGIFLALAVLSKTLFLGAFLFSLFVGGYFIFRRYGLKTSLLYIVTLISTLTIVYIILFPAMWVAPIKTISKIFVGSFEVGNELGHKQIYFGELVRDPGWTFYPMLLVLKLSLLSWIGILLFVLTRIVTSIKTKTFFPNLKTPSFELLVAIYYLGYFVVITYFSKKVDRYPTSIYPFLSLIAVLGYSSLNFKKSLAIVALAGYSIFYPLIRSFPHYLTATSPIIGNAHDGNEIIGQKLFGIGVFDLRDHLIENYGENVKVAMNDYETLASIRPEGTVFDISSTHPNSYTLVILGPNKDFPDSVLNTGIKFTHRSSVYINGLEFWRIYKERGH